VLGVSKIPYFYRVETYACEAVRASSARVGAQGCIVAERIHGRSAVGTEETGGASEVGRSETGLGAHISRGANSGRHTTEAGANEAARALWALVNTELSGECARRTRKGIPVAIAGAVCTGRTGQLNTEWTVKPRRAFTTSSWVSGTFRTIHTFVTRLRCSEIFQRGYIDTSTGVAVHACGARNGAAQLETAGRIIKRIIGCFVILAIRQLHTLVVETESPSQRDEGRVQR
jgi:hypothetical protein